MVVKNSPINILEYLGLEEPKEEVLQLPEREMKQLKFFTELRLNKEGTVLVKGQPGAGKTTLMVYMAFIRRKFWGYPIVSNIPLKPAIGEYTYVDTETLVDEFLKVNAAVEKDVKKARSGPKKLSDEETNLADSAWAGSGVNLHKCTLIWDEGYGSLDRRRAMSPKLILLSYLVQQRRHFGSLILIASSTEKLLDDIRINPFATHEANCGHYEKLKLSAYDVFNRHAPYRVGLNPQRITLEILNWVTLFDSFCPVGIDSGILKAVLKENKL